MPHKEQIKAGGEPNEINELYANLAELTKLDRDWETFVIS